LPTLGQQRAAVQEIAGLVVCVRGQQALLVLCLNLLGAALLARGQNDAARSFLEQGLAQARRFGHDEEIGYLLGNLARVHKALGRYDEAAGLMTEALERAQGAAQPNHEGVALQTNNLANLQVARGRWDAALPLFEQALAVCDAHGVAVHRPLVLMNLARAHHALGHVAEARSWAQRGLELARLQGRELLVGHLRLLQARLAIAEGDAGAARGGILDALTVAGRLGLAAEQTRCVVVYAELLALQRTPADAAALLRWAGRQPGLPADDLNEIERQLRTPAIAAASPATSATPATVPDGESPAALAVWLAEQCRPEQM